MRNLETQIVREQLTDRRRRLQDVRGRSTSVEIVQLLRDVDAALERLDSGTFGLCDACHEPVESERLLANPLARLCLDHLNEDQRSALERDLDLASRVQAGLLPQNDFEGGGWRISYHYEPAGIVSGDYCDVLAPAKAKDGIVFALGDISGKGIAASLLMSHIHAIFRSLSVTGLPLPDLLREANRVFCESTLPTQFATLVCGRLFESGDIEICNAGHCEPLVIRHREIQTLTGSHLPLGLFCDVPYATHRLTLSPGDSLLLYSDGVTEAWSPDEVEYGVERLSHVAASSLMDTSPRALINRCIEDVAGFTGPGSRRDDLTLMVIARS